MSDTRGGGTVQSSEEADNGEQPTGGGRQFTPQARSTIEFIRFTLALIPLVAILTFFISGSILTVAFAVAVTIGAMMLTAIITYLGRTFYRAVRETWEEYE